MSDCPKCNGDLIDITMLSENGRVYLCADCGARFKSNRDSWKWQAPTAPKPFTEQRA